MNIRIEIATTREQWDTICSIRKQVFTSEWGFQYGKLDPPGQPGVWHAIASDSDCGKAVGTLSVVDTTQETGLHNRYHLPFGCNDRSARYAQLAILKPSRKLGILNLLIDAVQDRIVRPNGFDFGWLLYPSASTSASVLSSQLGFLAVSPILNTEFGVCRAFVRRESDWRHTENFMELELSEIAQTCPV